MPTGIDVGPRTLRVATAAGTSQYRNAIYRVPSGDEPPDAEGVIVIDRGDDRYCLGPAGAVATLGDPVGRVLGGADAVDPGIRREAVGEFLTAATDDAEGAVRVAAWRPGENEPLAAAAADAGVDLATVDPGMAVAYDALEAPATGLAIAIDEARAVATLAVAGVPVAAARVDVDGNWFDVGRAAHLDGDDGDEDSQERDSGEGVSTGPSAAWRARQYETLFAELAERLGRGVPALADPVPVVLGGAAAPTNVGEVSREALAAALPIEVGEVSVADEPTVAVCRGALAAAEADDGATGEPPLPPFAVDVPFVGALADFRAATAALGAGAREPAAPRRGGDSGDGAVGASGGVAAATGGGADVAASGVAGVASGVGAGTAAAGEPDVDALAERVSRTRAALASVDRRGAMTARGLSDVVDQLEEGGGTGGEAVAALRADLQALESRLPDEEGLDALTGDLDAELAELQTAVDDLASDLERVEASAVGEEQVADIEASLASLEAAIAAVEDDTDTLRAVLAGLETDEEIDAQALTPEEVETLQAQALQDEISELEDSLEERVGDLWNELDEVDDRLRDLAATAEDVPDLESTVTDVRNTVSDLEEETAALADTVDSLEASVEGMTDDTASAGELAAVRDDLEAVRGSVGTLRDDFESVDRVAPATVAGIEDDLDALRQTLITRAERLEAVESTADNLSERIETVYQNSAKSEALASVETEVARIRQTATNAMERTNDMTETVSSLGTTVDDHAEQLGMLSTNVDNLAANAVTRPEMDSDMGKLEDRLASLESEMRAEVDELRDLVEEARHAEGPGPALEGDLQLVVTLQAAALVFIGLLGAFLAVDAGLVLVAGGFLVFAIMPGVLSWLVS